MKVTQKIEKNIDCILPGTTFTYQALSIEASEYTAATKAIERLLKKKLINRVSTGVFYKPKQTVFGELKPSEEELLRPYLFDGTKRTAYITGTALYNKMGLTTQIPKNIKVACQGTRIITRIGSMQVTPIKSYVEVTNENYTLLEILDALKDFKIIPDLDKKMAIRFLLSKIKNLPDQKKERMIKIALKYPPRVRAFLGALISELKINENTLLLKQSINPLSEYSYGIKEEELSTITNWNIC
ncbi:MAG: hypothetical protein JNL63_13380 [Bacteroidia bacterium]|nr:hypothetical protein [Bacteroidia bacterium]